MYLSRKLYYEFYSDIRLVLHIIGQPSWTGVPYLYRFLIQNQGPGPFASEAVIEAMQPGDVIQLGDENQTFYHTLIVTDTGEIPNTNNILIASHTNDSLRRPLNTYQFMNIRYLHIEGVRHQT